MSVEWTGPAPANCNRCLKPGERETHTGFGLEWLCLGCHLAVRSDQQVIAAEYPLSLEDYAAWCSWKEYMRLHRFCIDMRGALKRRMREFRNGASSKWRLAKGDKRTEWTGIVEGWYRHYRGWPKSPTGRLYETRPAIQNIPGSEGEVKRWWAWVRPLLSLTLHWLAGASWVLVVWLVMWVVLWSGLDSDR